MTRWIRRLIVPATIICLLVASGVALAQEDSGGPPPPEQEPPDCRECHLTVYQMWEDSAHGKGLSCGQCHLGDQNNHGREGHGAQGGPGDCMVCHTTGYDAATDTWEEDEIHCKACHSPIELNHPQEPMPTDRSVELCGQCHIQARFDWQLSKHGAAGVACVSCHSQHNTSLKSASVIEQCTLCHKEVAAGFSHTLHNQEGLSCANCHLASIEGDVGSGSARRSHTFETDVKTCMECHKEGLHEANNSSPAPVSFTNSSNKPLDPMTSSMTTEVTGEPAPVDLMSLVVVAGLFAAAGAAAVGLAFATLSPKLSSFGRRKTKETRRAG
ncbi:MAG: hypothetical protein JSW55_00915 [Chloroflexota bacterium]|nr:MAG: hypothetical protein JSW55_00915 [Chloroflexota bacterium]